MSSADFRRVIDINLMGSYHFAAAVLPHLTKGSRLALVASLARLQANAVQDEAARSALLDSVRAHLVSDVPVGVFLSGGMDSTAMAVLAQEVRKAMGPAAWVSSRHEGASCAAINRLRRGGNWRLQSARAGCDRHSLGKR